ncbi:zf-HC2 domain-containing protein [Tuberibacillus sp. Marseille-P3662]|uniref:zf-HC2 domain-containing protein n=1 Tax=Tuberibacillus sp. Marseille-P3662 TaxID=1965358 RepID=UPI000A1CBB03|nr:zf-HC2 domain-containing protein [Tuberibacillus sp. Marseille-P3662]
MGCSKTYISLIQKMLDGDTSEEEKQDIHNHISYCEPCRRYYDEMSLVDRQLHSLSHQTGDKPSQNFTDQVMQQLPKEDHNKRFRQWLKRHPMVSAAAVFLVLMMGYIFSMWVDRPFNAYVQGEGQLQYASANTVIVPEGETIKGDLVVENGHVDVKGQVSGDVILIKNSTLKASAGSVAGDIEEVNQIMEWVWYNLKDAFKHLFFISIETNS